MRQRILIAGLALITFVLIGIWVYFSQPMPLHDTIKHVASTIEFHLAVESTGHAADAIVLGKDLGTRIGRDWPSFLGPTGDGKSLETGIQPWQAEGPPVRWSVETGEGYAAPSVCRGRLLIFDRLKSEARCRCLNSETGQELWRFSYQTDYLDRQGYDGGPRASPVTDGYRVYLHGPEGMLHCLRLEDGQLLWKVDTFSTWGVVQNLFGAGSTPLIEEDRLILQVGGSPAGSSDRDFMTLKSNGSCIVAFDKVTGHILYQCGDDLASYATPQVVNMDGKRVGLMFARSGLLAFDPEKGKELFRYPFRARSYNSVNASNPVVHGDQIFLTESYELGSRLLKVKASQVEAIWSATSRERDKGLSCHWNTLILVDGHIYCCASRHRNDAELRCIELATGKVKWIARPTWGDEPAGRSSFIFVDGHFLYLSEEGWLFMIKANPARFEQMAVWDGQHANEKYRLNFPCWAGPVLSRGLLYLRGKGRLACLEVISSNRQPH